MAGRKDIGKCRGFRKNGDEVCQDVPRDEGLQLRGESLENKEQRTVQHGELIIESKEMADELSRHFASIFTTEDTSNIPEKAATQEMGEAEELGKITITSPTRQ